MSTFKLNINTDEVVRKIDKTLKNYDRLVTRAVSMGINRTIRHVQTKVVRAIADETGYKQKLVRDSLWLMPSNINTLTAHIEARRRGEAINLIEFVRKNRQTPAFFRRRYKSNSKRRGHSRGQFKYRGVEANAWNESKTYRGTFIGRDKNGNLKVFKRTGNSKSKVTLVSAPSIPSTFVKTQTMRYLERVAKARFGIEFERAAAHLIRQASK